MTNQECQGMQQNVLEYLRNDATDGDKAIVTMLTILVNQMNYQHECMDRVAKATEQLSKNFEQVTAGGQVMLTEAVLR